MYNVGVLLIMGIVADLSCSAVPATGGPVADPEAAWHRGAAQGLRAHAELHAFSHREDAVLRPGKLSDA